MTDPLTWSINLGRWAGTRVRVHVLLLIFAADKLLEAAWAKEGGRYAVGQAMAWLGVLLGCLLLKQMAQAAMARRIGVDWDEVRLWPLGNLTGPSLSASERSPEIVLITAAGLASSLVLALVTAVGLRLAGASMIFNPFGNPITGGAPGFAKDTYAAAFTPIWYLGWFGYLNWVLFLANIWPALPLDGGRIYCAVVSARSRDGSIVPHTARAVAALFVVVALARWLLFQKPGGTELIALAVLIEWMVRIEARMLDDGGFFDDGVFGYDFSQGYTSLEAGAATVRQPREGAIKRWRRRRTELMRRRREAREAAEESRMDVILEKLHREGRPSLTDEEQRFLVRVSARYRKKVRGS